MSKEPKKPILKKGEHSYQDCEKFVRYELNNLKKERQLKVFCTDHELNYHSVSMFLNEKIEKDTPNLISDILTALGYQVEIKKEITFKVISKS